MKAKHPEGVNMSFTLDKEIATWIRKRVRTSDLNQSQVARRVFREAIEREKVEATVGSTGEGETE